MIKPVYAWPTKSTTQFHHQDSSSKLKRNAMTFLSNIRGDEEESKAAQEAISKPITSHETALFPTLTSDAGWVARLRGDITTEHILTSSVRTDKSHRLFLSWDRSYPTMVYSLVVPAQTVFSNPKTQIRKNNLDLPRNELDGYDNFNEEHHHEKLSTRDSSSEDDLDSYEREISFGFLLKHPPQTSNDDNINAFQSYSPRIQPISGNNLSSMEDTASSPLTKKLQGISLTNSQQGPIQYSSEAEDEENSIGEAPNSNRKQVSKINVTGLSWDTDYSFSILDDSKINQGKHRVVLNDLDYYRISIIPYIKTKVLKEELNNLFRKQNPGLPEDLTLSKVRKLKKEMLERARTADFELSTVSLAYVYFEKLILKGVVHKTNRKIVAFTCLVLAFKFNEYEQDKLRCLLQEIDKINKISKHEIFLIEFAVFAHLRFNLNLPGKDYFGHFVKLIRSVDIAPSEYFGGTHEEATNLLKLLSIQGKIQEEKRRRSSTESSDHHKDEEEQDNNSPHFPDQ